MPSSRQPAAALADRAERHVFERLGDLPAVERRALALVELAGVEVAAAAAQLGSEEEAVRSALAAGRKALRRTLTPLASGARCERAERSLSDRIDTALDWRERRWLEIHLARCPRCVSHVELLERARAELAETFGAVPPALPPAPEPPATPEAGDGRAQLRVVPPAPEPEPPAEPQVAEVGDRKHAIGAVDGPLPEAGAPAQPAEPRAAKPAAKPRAARTPSPAARRAAKVIAIVLAVAALLAGLGVGIDALSGSDEPQTAPWAQPGAPDIKPAPLSGQ